MLTFVLGIIVGVLLLKLWEYKQTKNIKITWLEYFSGAILFLWILTGATFFFINLGEGETRAASLGSLIFGLVALLGFVAIRKLYRRNRKELYSQTT